MLLTRALPAASLLTFAAFLIPAPAADPPPPAKPTRLPLARVVLFTAGVGYFHREGTVDGTAQVDVRVPQEDVNDLIKTLIAADAGGTPRAVTYDNKAPAEVALKAFQIDLTENPTVAQLLGQVRGEVVKVVDKNGTAVAGTIVSVETPEAKVIAPPSPAEDEELARTGPDPDKAFVSTAVQAVVVPPPADAVERVNLLTDDGIQSVPLAGAKRVRFLKPELQTEFRKALDALAAARGAATKTVGVTFAGEGKRQVSLGYVTEAPLWKPTYRVTLNGAGAKVEGWVAVENTTDEDWENVKLSLVSGRPTTFQMDLYDPLFVPRPLVDPEMYASLRPPLYQGQTPGAANFMGGFGGGGFGGGNNFQSGFGGGAQGGGQSGGGKNLGAGGGIFGSAGMGNTTSGPPPASKLTRPSVRSLTGNRLTYEEFRGRQAGGGTAEVLREVQDLLDPRRPGGASADFGQSFRYDVADPVSLPRFKSALLPVVNETAGIERVSVFNPQVLDRHPMLGVRLTNKAKQFLAQGPVAVYDGGTYAGDARLPDVKPGETRLLGYAIDLEVEVIADPDKETRSPAGVTVGPQSVDHPTLPARTQTTLTERTTVRGSVRYTIRNRSTQPRAVLVTRPVTPGRTLVVPDKPTERTADLYRFEVKVAPGATATLDVVEEWTETAVKPVADLTAEAIDRYLQLAAAPAGVKAALARVRADRAKLADTEKAAADEDAALKAIADDQARIRSNIERVPKESQAFQRYLKKFDDQETEIEKRQARVRELRSDLTRQRQALDDYLRDLKAE